VAQILSVGMMLQYSFGLEIEAGLLEKAVDKTLSSGILTRDIQVQGKHAVGTREMGDAIVENIKILKHKLVQL